MLFPRTAARQARGEDTADILGRSLLVAAGFCSLLTLFYALTGRGLVHTSFGEDFADGGSLLVPLTLSMTLFALANVLVGFHLSRGETRFAWIVAATIPVQIAALAVIPSSVRGVILVDIVIGVCLLAAHELFVGSSVPALRAGLGRVGSERWTRIRRATIEGLARRRRARRARLRALLARRVELRLDVRRHGGVGLGGARSGGSGASSRRATTSSGRRRTS